MSDPDRTPPPPSFLQRESPPPAETPPAPPEPVPRETATLTRSPRAFNRIQILKAVLGIVISVIAFALCYLFFWAVASYGHRMLSTLVGDYDPQFAAWVCLGIVAIGGTLHYRAGKGHESIGDSSLVVTLDAHSGGSFATEHYLNRVGGSAYLLSQTFLAGPLQFFKALNRLRTLVPTDDATENALNELLARVHERKSWHSIAEYPNEGPLLIHLIRMKEVDFSATKRTVKYANKAAD